MKRRLPLLALLGIFALPATADEDAPGLPAEVARVSVRALTPAVDAVGSLEANERIQVRPEQDGRIHAIRFREGERVAAGAPLFELDATTYEAELKQAEARLNLSRLAYSRANSLLQRRLGSETERDNARAQLRVDEAGVELARTRLEKMTIRAPFAGVAGLRRVSPGDYVSVGQDLVELIDGQRIKVDFRIPEIYLPSVQPGQPLEVRVDALPGRTFSGEVYAIAPAADAASHSIRLRARVDNPAGLLRPGLFAQVRLLGESGEQALFVPEQAIMPQNGQFSVLRVDAGNKVEQVRVELGQRRPGEVQVLDGLAGGDLVVTAGQLKLQPGMAVTPVFVDESDAGAEQARAR